MEKYNFCAGPATLPKEVYKATADAILDFNNSSLSILEISHRSKDFQLILDEARDLFKDLLNIPTGYSVLFLGGGASLQFCMVPYNLLEKKAAYLNTGTWASKAIKEAKYFGDVIEVASSKDKNFSYIPKDYKIPTNVDYFHITTNNTIYGTELHYDIESPVTLVADMSSDIFSRPIDISNYGLIYGGAQKNLGPAGVSFVIIKDDILGKVTRPIPSMLDYRLHIENGSMYNTPPVGAIYTCLLTLRWLKKNGGVNEMYKRNVEKAKILYNEIDRSSIFVGTAAIEDRSLMNVCFVMATGYEEYEKAFIDFTMDRGLVAIKGHRSVGGFRASIYNAMPREGVEALVSAMQDFEEKIKR